MTIYNPKTGVTKESSEVFEIFKKNMLKSKASVSEKAKSVETSMTNAEKSVKSLLNAAGETQLADDSSLDNEKEKEEEQEEYREKKALVINELKVLAEKAFSEGYFKLGYKIERTIEEIIEDQNENL